MKTMISGIKPCGLLTGMLLVCVFTLHAQKVKSKPEVRIAMMPEFWEYDTAAVEFITQNNVRSVYLKNGSPIYLKNQKFSNGTIEYDVEFGGGFPGITFRMSDDRKFSENFYLRYFGSTSPDGRTTLQYATIIDGLSMWDLTDEYQAAATLKIPGWNHVKLVISG